MLNITKLKTTKGGDIAGDYILIEKGVAKYVHCFKHYIVNAPLKYIIQNPDEKIEGFINKAEWDFAKPHNANSVRYNADKNVLEVSHKSGLTAEVKIYDKTSIYGKGVNPAYYDFDSVHPKEFKKQSWLFAFNGEYLANLQEILGGSVNTYITFFDAPPTPFRVGNLADSDFYALIMPYLLKGLAEKEVDIDLNNLL